MRKTMWIVSGLLGLMTLFLTSTAGAAYIRCSPAQMSKAYSVLSQKLNSPSLIALEPYSQQPLPQQSQISASGLSITYCVPSGRLLIVNGFFTVSGAEPLMAQTSQPMFTHPYDGSITSPYGAFAWLWASNVGEFYVYVVQ